MGATPGMKMLRPCSQCLAQGLTVKSILNMVTAIQRMFGSPHDHVLPHLT